MELTDLLNQKWYSVKNPGRWLDVVAYPLYGLAIGILQNQGVEFGSYGPWLVHGAPALRIGYEIAASLMRNTENFIIKKNNDEVIHTRKKPTGEVLGSGLAKGVGGAALNWLETIAVATIVVQNQL